MIDGQVSFKNYYCYMYTTVFVNNFRNSLADLIIILLAL